MVLVDMRHHTPEAAKAYERRASRRLRALIVDARKDIATVDKVVVFAEGDGPGWFWRDLGCFCGSCC
jgi:hypothetical protein